MDVTYLKETFVSLCGCHVPAGDLRAPSVADCHDVVDVEEEKPALL